MDYLILFPAAMAVVGVGAVTSLVGWVLRNRFETVPVSVGTWTLAVGIVVAAAGLLLAAWPLLFIFATHPA